MATGDQRRWAGTTLDDRRAVRTDQLLQAAYELMGDTGAAAVTVRGVCRRARLSERYFYESFADREELLLAVYSSVANAARERVISTLAPAGSDPAARTRATVEAYTHFFEEDRRRGRILLLEPLTNEHLARYGQDVMRTFVVMLSSIILAGSPDADGTDASLGAAAIVGGLTSLYLGYLDGTLEVPRDRFVDHVAQFIERVAGITSGNR